MTDMTYNIDFTGISGKEALHDYLTDALCLPDYYGRNLDALYDCLTEFPECEIIITDTGTLDEYIALIMDVFSEAAEDNPNIHLFFI